MKEFQDFMDHQLVGMTLGSHSFCGLKFANPFGIPVHVGKFTSISGGLTIVGGNHPGIRENKNNVSSFPFKETLGLNYPRYSNNGPIEIYNDVWIGMNSFIFSGVNIGSGAIIGACSTITKDVLPYEVVVGNNRKIRSRFSPLQIQALLAIRWWDWSIDDIMKHIDDFRDIDVFIEKYHGL